MFKKVVHPIPIIDYRDEMYILYRLFIKNAVLHMQGVGQHNVVLFVLLCVPIIVDEIPIFSTEVVGSLNLHKGRVFKDGVCNINILDIDIFVRNGHIAV